MIVESALRPGPYDLGDFLPQAVAQPRYILVLELEKLGHSQIRFLLLVF